MLVLSNNQLIGTIPKEVGNLTTLSVLNLNSNHLEGTIPTELGRCTALTTLDPGNNNLNGPIPENLADLAQLQCLVLSYNNLSSFQVIVSPFNLKREQLVDSGGVRYPTQLGKSLLWLIHMRGTLAILKKLLFQYSFRRH